MALDLLLTAEAVCLDKHPNDPKAKIVACTSPEAAFQLVGEGTPISAEDAEKFGVKTKKAEATATLRIDSHTIAKTPEDKEFAATQPQPALTAARAEHMRTAAGLSVASAIAADYAKTAETAEDSKKADAAANKKLKAKTENKAKKPRKARAKKAEKKEEAATPATP